MWLKKLIYRLKNISFGKIGDEEKLDFIKNLALLYKSGFPINESFNILAIQAKVGPLKNFLIKSRKKIEKGHSLHQSFKENPSFGPIFVHFIKTGEEAGSLDENFKFLASWLDHNMTLKREISSATLYPKIIITFAILLAAGLVLFILPKLMGVFEGLGIKLPIITRILLSFFAFIQESGFFVVVGLFFLIFLYKVFNRFKSFKRKKDRFLLKLPVIGPLYRDYQLTIICQLTATLFRAGTSISYLLTTISESVSSITYQESIMKMKEKVEKGVSFSQTMKEFPNLYPPIFINLITVGEKTGSFEESFSYLADFFLSRVMRATKRLPVIIEPVLLISIGIFVAFIAMAIIMPIYEITKGLH